MALCISVFLADRTNSRAFATVLRLLSLICLLSVCIVAKRCVLEQKLLLTSYRSRIYEIDWY